MFPKLWGRSALRPSRLPICAANNNIFLPEHGVILFCVAKAGNTSIKRAVIDALVKAGDPLTKDRWEGTREPWINTHRHPALRRTPLADIARDPRSKGAFKAAFVRNPYDRLVSCYTERVLGGKPLRGLAVSPDMSFEEFAEQVCAVSDEEIDIHLESQHRSFVWKGEMVADFIGSVEGFATDWEQVISRSSLPLAPVESKNRSAKRERYEAYYDATRVEKVARRYEQDLSLLGYGFDAAQSPRLPWVPGAGDPQLGVF